MSHAWLKISFSFKFNLEEAAFTKNLTGYMNRVDWDVFPYHSKVGDDESGAQLGGKEGENLPYLILKIEKKCPDCVHF